MCLKAFPLLLLALLAIPAARAQLMDSLPRVIRSKYNIDARLESRLALNAGEFTHVNGVRLGVAWQRKLRLGGGVSWLGSKVIVPWEPYETHTGVKDSKFLKFGYLCYYIDFVFYKTKRWQLSVPLQAGPGLFWFQEHDAYDLFSPEPKHFMFLYEPGVTVQFKIFRWLGLGNDVAYRFVLKSSDIKQRISAPVYAFKILFWPDQLFFVMFPKNKATQRFGPAYW